MDLLPALCLGHCVQLVQNVNCCVANRVVRFRLLALFFSCSCDYCPCRVRNRAVRFLFVRAAIMIKQSFCLQRGVLDRRL